MHDQDEATKPIRPLVDSLVKRYDPEEIWLFGSRAEGRARPGSDWDLLIVLPDSAPESDLELLEPWKIAHGLGIPADIVPCLRSEFEEEKDEIDSLPRAAVRKGRRVYVRSA